MSFVNHALVNSRRGSDVAATISDHPSRPIARLLSVPGHFFRPMNLLLFGFF